MTAAEKSETDIEEADYETLMTLAVAAADGFRSLSLAAEGGSLSDVGGASCWYSASSVPAFNGASIFHNHLINPETLNTISAFFNARGPHYSLVTMDALVPDAPLLLPQFGYAQYDATPAMWLDTLPDDIYAGSGALQVSQVRSESDLAVYRSLLGTIFGLPRSEVELVLGEGALEVPHVKHYIGRLGNMAVGTTSLVLTGRVASVWNVGTHVLYRRQGVAERLVRQALCEARSTGYTASMLLSSREGLPLYLRMGYRTLSTLRIFVPCMDEGLR